MPARISAPSVLPSPSARFLPLLMVLFVGSGCSALIYEIVWFQLLQLVIGSTAVSIGVLLGTFMGGMCLGSLIFPWIVSRRWHPLRFYALLELGIGVFGLSIPFLLPHIDRFYIAHASAGLSGVFLRGGVAALCLLPPTLLMGATLPAIARWVESTPRGVSWLGFFYGGNIAGAVCGCLLAGFYLLRVYDMATATYVAAALNGIVATVGLVLAFVAPHRAAPSGEASGQSAEAASAALPLETGPAWPAYVAIALSGMSALGAEVIWTRILALMLGATVYTFSIILAVFLVGLGLGSTLGAIIARSTLRPRLALGLSQLSLAACAIWTAYMLAASLPYWPINPHLTQSPWFIFQIDLVRCAWAILPPTFFWGASFPLAIAAVATPKQDPGRLVGGVYAANTVGAIVGAVGFSMVLIGWIGTRHSQWVLVTLPILAALLMLVPALWQPRRDRPRGDAEYAWGRIAVAVPLLAIVVGLLAYGVYRVPAAPWQTAAFGREAFIYPGDKSQDTTKLLYLGEGMNSTVAATEHGDGTRYFHVAGKVEASSNLLDMRLQRMLGHLSALLHKEPQSVLIVGCGAGVTAGTFVLHPEIKRIVICEIEPLIPPLAGKYFAKQNYDVVKNPRVEIVYDDARHFLLTTREKFDVITSDPIHPWVKGSAALYSKEYFELCTQHLNPGGVVTQWVPLYESAVDVVRCELKTFFEAFPSGIIWGNDNNGGGYDVVVSGQVAAAKIDVDAIQKRIDDSPQISASLEEVGFRSAADLLATYSAQAGDLKDWLATADINRDSNMRLQYLAGMGLNLDKAAEIFGSIIKNCAFPPELFQGSESELASLKAGIEKRNADTKRIPTATSP